MEKAGGLFLEDISKFYVNYEDMEDSQHREGVMNNYMNKTWEDVFVCDFLFIVSEVVLSLDIWRILISSIKNEYQLLVEWVVLSDWR